MTRKHSFLRPAFVLVTMLAAVLGASAAFAGTGPAKPGTDGYAKSTTIGSVDPQFLTGARTVAHWTFQYTDPSNGVTYPITMVGSDPRQGGSSTVKTEIIPLKINFVAGNQDLRALNAFYGINATPLAWTHAQFIRLAWDATAGRVLEQPGAVAQRYLHG